MVYARVPFDYQVETVLIRLWLLLIQEFVFVNFQFKLIIRDKFSSLQTFFLSLFTRLFCGLVNLHGRSGLFFFVFLLLLSFSF